MTAPHRIKRLVLELDAPDPPTAQHGQSVLSQLHEGRLAPLLARLCDELCPPGRLVRIDRLTVDLGELDATRLAESFLATLTRQLRTSLSRALHADPPADTDAPTDPELEALAVFARTGNLPWWSETRSPSLLRAGLYVLLDRSPDRLAALLRELVREPQALLRLVLHFDDPALTSLVELLARTRDISQPNVAPLLAALEPRLAASPALATWPANRRRALLWRSLLAVSARASGPTPLADRLGELRDEAARLAGVDVDALLTLPDAGPGPSGLPTLISHARAHADGNALPRLLDHLQERLAPHASPLDPDTWLRHELARFARAAAANRTLLARALSELTAAGREQTILRDAIASALPSPTDAPIPPAPEPSQHPTINAAPEPLQHPTIPSSPEPSQHPTISSSHAPSQPPTISSSHAPSQPSTSPPPAVPQTTANSPDPPPPASSGSSAGAHAPQLAALRTWLAAHDPVPGLERSSLTHLLDVLSTFPAPADLDLPAQISAAVRRGELTREQLLHSLALLERPPLAPGGPQEPWAGALRVVLAAHAPAPPDPRSAARALPRGLRAPHAAPKLAQRRPPALDLGFSQGEEVYVADAGLVLLWPFLTHFLRYLGFTEDHRFRDPAAQQRAAAVLRATATGEREVVEYQLPLARILCGLALDVPIDPGPPVRDDEAEQGTQLLQAVIARAPVLGKMSVPGLRGSFLLRDGVLGVRDGTWLLRVERRGYDLVLDRFPWAFDWLKLPWMEMAMRVEW